ncbi:Zn(2)-C6 fungal-type domain-containing protein [Mycena chlorophos]|uniref:Zn(2)-C6 fungal-type domain-containing protein n=1 Tax=Mycena chlorophos TaxID=658473 RepID=A0A8H6VWF3_MYCCL|nr:Zn(2)-C6 fungal-type domain-containing protein [Mycena chlorophos]
MSSDEPRLPPELERDIFELAADTSDESMAALLYVARRTHLWIEPLVYRDIHVNATRRFASFLAATKSKPASFFAQHVSRLFLHVTISQPVEDVCEALKLCTGVTRIAGVGPVVIPIMKTFITGMQLERIGLFLTHIFPRLGDYPNPAGDAIDLSLPCFQSLTHFDVFDYLYKSEEADPYVAKLCALPALTHLAMNDVVPWTAIETLLAQCKLLKVLIVLWSGSRKEGVERAREMPFEDDRFVMAVYADVDGSIQYAPNLWTNMEEFIRAKRERRIEGNRYWVGKWADQEVLASED